MTKDELVEKEKEWGEWVHELLRGTGVKYELVKINKTGLKRGGDRCRLSMYWKIGGCKVRLSDHKSPIEEYTGRREIDMVNPNYLGLSMFIDSVIGSSKMGKGKGKIRDV